MYHVTDVIIYHVTKVTIYNVTKVTIYHVTDIRWAKLSVISATGVHIIA